MRTAVLVKQVPRFEELSLRPDGRLDRDGTEVELNPYCRRAVAKGVELAAETGGECVVFTLGPEAAEDALREAIAWGATRGVHLCDVAFAGSDTLATSRALATALRLEGPFDLILAGRNSVDAETAQVGPEVAELLDLPMLAGVRTIELSGDGMVTATCERDDGYAVSTTRLPALVTTAERLCNPAKVPPERRAAVPADRVTRRDAASLGPGPWGLEASPTSVGGLRAHPVDRARTVLTGQLTAQVAGAAAQLHQLVSHPQPDTGRVPGTLPVPAATVGHQVAVLIETGRELLAREMLGEAAVIAAELGGYVTAIVPGGADVAPLGTWGADHCVVLRGSMVEQDVARTLRVWAESARPWALLVPATVPGCEIGSRLAAGSGLGLTGDVVELSIDGGRLVGWKPAFGGQVLAAVESSSDIQMCTVRPGMLPVRAARESALPSTEDVTVAAVSPTVHRELVRDDDVEELARAGAVVCVGAGVAAEDYARLEELRTLLGAELAGTRKVTDVGTLPRARQIGITGRSIAPRLFVSIGASGKFNHMIGSRSAGFVVAINHDAAAPVFAAADLGIVGDWREVVPALVAALRATRCGDPAVACSEHEGGTRW